jgi:hypothetical protein
MSGPAYIDAFRRIRVLPDDVVVAADAVDDQLTLVAGAGISLVANANSDQITIVNTNTSSPSTELFAKSITVDGIIIDTNVIRSTDSNADLELDANGSGKIFLKKSLFLEYPGIIDFPNGAFIGSGGDGFVISGGESAPDVPGNVNIFAQSATLSSNQGGLILINGGAGITVNPLVPGTGGDVLIKGGNADNNVNPGGIVNIEGGQKLNGFRTNVTINDVIFSSLSEISNINKLTLSDIEIYQNILQTTVSNQNLELRASGTGAIQLRNNLKLSDGTSPDGEWVNFTPTWTGSTTNPVIGNGLSEGRYKQVGNTVHVWMMVTMGSTTTFGTGEYKISLPVTARAIASVVLNLVMYDNGTRHYNSLAHNDYTTGTSLDNASVTLFWDTGVVTNTAPFTWADGDWFIVSGSYEAS